VNMSSRRLIPIVLAMALTVAAGCKGHGPGAGTPTGPVKPAEKFILLYATAILGELVDCGCPAHPRGGLARRAEVARGLGAANAGHFLHVDGGDAFFPSSGPNAANDEQKKLALVIARSFAHMGINAVNVGPMDLAAGLPFLRDQLAKAGETELPFVSANILDPATGKTAFPASREFKIGERNVCVYGLSETISGDPSVSTSDPTAAAKTQNAELRPRCDLVVGLYAMSIHDAGELSRQAPGADVIIVSHPSSSPAPKPLVLGDTALTQAGSRGMYLGRLDLTLLPTKPATTSSLSGEERARLEAELTRVVAQKKLLEGDISSDPQLAAIFNKAKNDEAALREKLGQAASGYDYENALISLDLAMPEEPQVAAWVKETGVKPKSHGQPATLLPMAPSTPVAPGK